MQFMRPYNCPGNLDTYLSMMMRYNQLPGELSLVSDCSQRSGKTWGRSVSVMVLPAAMERILSNGYRLRGPAGNLTFYGRVVKAHAKEADQAACEVRKMAAAAAARAAEDAAALNGGDESMMDETNDAKPPAPGTSGILPAAGASGCLDERKKRWRSPSSSTGMANSISQEKKKACLAMGACGGPEPNQGAAGAQPGNLNWVEDVEKEEAEEEANEKPAKGGKGERRKDEDMSK
jgi:hypothetical protein